ncbi:MAG: hypothetical protein GY796_03010 [Chloroflexi bacterium]|nr:hypothetical protein [Chloroflexota bacterium]
MKNISPFKRVYYTYLGYAFSFAYHTDHRRFLWFAISSWLKFVTVVLFFAALGLRWDTVALALTLLLTVWVHFSYWRAYKQGYNKFVVGKKIPTAGEKAILAEDEKVSLYASGVFAVTNQGATVLLRPSEYWRNHRGDHTVMVSRPRNKFLYQFFTADTLLDLRCGWMIFGKYPMKTLAVTFREIWGPNHADEVVTYMVGGGEHKNKKQKKRTIYLTFEEEAGQTAVWQAITQDLP